LNFKNTLFRRKTTQKNAPISSKAKINIGGDLV